jgi:hypothetical protein
MWLVKCVGKHGHYFTTNRNIKWGWGYRDGAYEFSDRLLAEAVAELISKHIDDMMEVEDQ